ncbi:MAG: HIT family protein [Flavobacteriia bacterium]
MSTLFTKIVRGEIPCHKVAENDHFLAFLDIMPLVKGHVLVIPKREEDYIFDLEDDELAGMIVFAKNVALKMKMVLPCRKIGVSVIGLEVPHAHIHLIPINGVADMDFSKEKLKLNPEELAETASLIAKQ